MWMHQQCYINRIAWCKHAYKVEIKKNMTTGVAWHIQILLVYSRESDVEMNVQ